MEGRVSHSMIFFVAGPEVPEESDRFVRLRGSLGPFSAPPLSLGFWRFFACDTELFPDFPDDCPTPGSDSHLEFVQAADSESAIKAISDADFWLGKPIVRQKP
jgi:hypothetical protein